MNTKLPWSNCRLQLASDFDEDSDLPGGVVGRLYYTAASHPAVRQSLQTLTPRKLSVAALALQHVVNKRGPDALIGCIPGEARHRDRLQQLCRDCHDGGEVLVCSTKAGDVVLVPRIPSTAEKDGLYFVGYATNIKAVELCDVLRRDGKVAVVLDIDNTLIDAAPVTVSESDWERLDWQHCTVDTASGGALAAQWCRLPHGCGGSALDGDGDEDALCEASYLMHWRMGRVSCTFLVRVRRGWSWFRAWLARRGARFTPFICSKGKLEYVQLLWHFLDPEGELLPRADWRARMTSTFPDSVSAALPKTALTALGCAPVLHPHVATQLAAPLVAVDDSHEAYLPDYAMNVLFVEEYRPSDDASAADSGSVLRQVASRLDAFWEVTCSEQGAGAWQAAQSFSSALLGTVCRTPMESPDALLYLQLRCRRQGEALWHQFTVDDVFGGDVFIADDPAMLYAHDGGGAEGHGHAAERGAGAALDARRGGGAAASPCPMPVACESASDATYGMSGETSSLALAGISEDEVDGSPTHTRERRPLRGTLGAAGLLEAF